jgi:hypothetical protein
MAKTIQAPDYFLNLRKEALEYLKKAVVLCNLQNEFDPESFADNKTDKDLQKILDRLLKVVTNELVPQRKLQVTYLLEARKAACGYAWAKLQAERLETDWETARYKPETGKIVFKNDMFSKLLAKLTN